MQEFGLKEGAGLIMQCGLIIESSPSLTTPACYSIREGRQPFPNPGI